MYISLKTIIDTIDDFLLLLFKKYFSLEGKLLFFYKDECDYFTFAFLLYRFILLSLF